MYKIKLLNKISSVGLGQLEPKKYTYGEDIENPDAILVRSADMHTMELPASLKAIARAGAGLNNIPIDKCTEAGIVVFNTPGANANAVKELIITMLGLSSRRIIEGIEWVKTLKDEGDNISKLVEKGKSQFVGPEYEGKKFGVIGLGAIGVMVSNAAHSLGMEVYGYDPYISVDAAWGLSKRVRHVTSLKTIFEECDYITLHVPVTPETKGMLNADAFSIMKPGMRILNFARGDLVNVTDLKDAIEKKIVARYATDFPSKELLETENTICVPHLGASTPESENNCAFMAARQVADYLEYGIVKNSANIPNVDLPKSFKTRICLIHKNIPKVLNGISSAIAAENLNIENMINRSRGNYAYTIMDVDSQVPESAIKSLESLEGIINVRVID